MNSVNAIKSNIRTKRAFSLVEILAAVVILGILTFIAIPNIVRMKEDSEVNLAIARAEAVNMGMASYIQAHGRSSAASTWAAAPDEASRYGLVKPYLAFAPASFDDYMPGGYTITLPGSIATLTKVVLKDADDETIDY